MSGISDSAKFNDDSSYYFPANGNTVLGVSSLNSKAGGLTISSADNSLGVTSGGTSIIDVSTANKAQAPSTVTATGAISGASLSTVGAVSGATVTASGAVTGSSVTATGAVQGGTLVATSSVTAVNANITGIAFIGGLEAGSVVTGIFTGVLGVGGAVNLFQVAQPCYLEIFCNANPSQGDARYIYQCLLVTASSTGGNLQLTATGAGLPVSTFGCVINAVNGAGGTPTAYGTPVAVNLGSVGGGGASQSWAGSYRVMALPNVITGYSGAIPSHTINYVVPP